jgi:hypothetical protein
MPALPGDTPPPSDLRFSPDGATSSVTPPAPVMPSEPAVQVHITPGGEPAHRETVAPVEQRVMPTARVADPGSDSSGERIPVASDSPPPDWLDQVCPYLLSEDGTWRSTQPDPGHRCMAQDPPGELPPMFQERFCLSDRHVRCEWFKAAQTTRAVGTTSGPVEAVATAEVRPIKPSGGGPSGPARPLVIGGALFGGFLVLLLIALIFGSGDGSDPDASPRATQAAGADTTPSPTSPGETIDPTVTPVPTEAPPLARVLIEYEVQPDELVLLIAEKFGIRRQAIFRANEGMADAKPSVESGQTILVPASGDMSRDDIAAIPGFVAFVDEAGG